ncbi:thioesterase II family protein [Mycobacterium hubeiense]|uniref:thioesterase II family protein n=1 Tax=Mycobacterium hubeiense TaxID=1867256 RepID=UPI000C7F4774|nr:thioesterase domain-containing protein [Mycobacterium sp. QGD 101]
MTFQPWIKRFPGGGAEASVVVFPHAGGAAAAYRSFATALSANGVDAYIVQYPQRADRLTHPAPATIEELAAELYEAGQWDRVGPLRLFGHCMGAVVAFEFARIAERHGVEVGELWASAGQAPSTIAGSSPLPTTDRELVADMMDLGGTDPRLLDDEDFVELLLMAVRADYEAFNRYSCEPGVRIRADIHAVGGRDDHRIEREWLQRWDSHTDGTFTLSLFDGGHFYLNDHTDSVAKMVSGQ